MKEDVGNLWTYASDAVVITTNGTLNKRGANIMGKGTAAQAKALWPGLPFFVGNWITRQGNVPGFFQKTSDYKPIATLPVKWDWRDDADIGLIVSSCVRIEQMFNGFDREYVVTMPRPGCGAGGLDWANVKPLIEPLLSDRFIVLHRWD